MAPILSDRSDGFPSPKFLEIGLLPRGVTFKASGQFGGAPKRGTEGTYVITVTATNSVGATSQDFTITVSYGHPVRGSRLDAATHVGADSDARDAAGVGCPV